MYRLRFLSTIIRKEDTKITATILKRKLHVHPALPQKPTRHDIYLVDEQENLLEARTKNINKYTERTFSCGELGIEHVGLRVQICGWLEYQRLGKFMVLRDGYGQTQLFIDENHKTIQKQMASLPLESILRVQGSVVSRPTDMINKKMLTGQIEVLVEKLEVLNKSKVTLPFNIRQFQKANEALRMQYRYLDMRFPEMQRNLRVRSTFLMNMRDFLANECGFVEVETPTLFKATPGGAQEFVVPTRFPDKFYSLVQSPQQFKQMLMAGAIDRYFQIARCYRDESCRPDRQPEFTQLDIELSFTNVEGVMRLTEELLQYCWPKFLKPLPKTFQRLTYNDAMERYGSDKPDVRFGLELRNCTDIVSESNVKLKPDHHAACIVFEEPYLLLSRSELEKIELNQFPNTNLVRVRAKNANDFCSKTEKLLSGNSSRKLADTLGLDSEFIMILVYGERMNTLKRLGKIRLDYAALLEKDDRLKVRKDETGIVWIYDFPLFEKGDKEDSLVTVHHPFTAPNTDDMDKLKSNPLEVRGQSYDLVYNGNEVGGGSIRIHDGKLQKQILQMLDIDPPTLEHMLEMLESGCPPHGGIALGLDRLLSEILGTTSIRDVIAFPKTFEGKDPISGAPSSISEADKKLYHLK